MSHTQGAAKDVGSAANWRRRSQIFLELTSSSLFHAWMYDYSPPLQGAVVPSTGLSVGPSGSGGSTQSFAGTLGLRLTSDGT